MILSPNLLLILSIAAYNCVNSMLSSNKASCGMPLTRIEDCGTNADGSTNFDYCQYCYKDSQFLQECTMDEMIEHCSQFVDEVNKNMPKPMTKDEYKQMMRGFFPMLKRWR